MALKEILFSRSTFQGVYQEGKEEFYPLIQLSKDNEMLSALCSCGSEEAVCKHAQALYEKVLTDSSRNISQDYDDSFLKAFFYHFFYYHEDSKVQASIKQDALICVFDEERLEFFADKKTLSTIKDILLNTEIKDETNSLEFSSLPDEELRLYQSRRPSFNFRFALSNYNDLAKFLFLKKSAKDIDVKVEQINQKQGTLSITIDGLVMKAMLSLKLISDIIPKLSPQITKTPLHQGSIESKVELSFDNTTQSLKIHRKKQNLPKEEMIDLQDYVFVSEVGFFSKHLDPIFEGDQIDDIPEFFRKYRAHISELFTGMTVFPEKQKAHYNLEMTATGNLRIFLDKAGKFTIHETRDYLFKPFVMIEKKTLVELEGVLFDEIAKQ